jgi:predicted DNA-binding ribbon-helix-helix protein
MNPDAEVRKRSVTIAGHQTSVSLETAFWDALKRLAASRGLSMNALIEEIDQTRSGNLSSAIRVHVLDRALAGEIGR